MKNCTSRGCKQNNPQPLTEFYKDGHNPKKLRSWCKSCHNISERLRQHSKSATRSERKRIYKYKITPQEFVEKIRGQGGICPICAHDLSVPSLDHDHNCCKKRPTCGKCNRGVVCRRCNSLLSFAEDSVDTLQRAIEYLVQWRTLCPQRSITKTGC
jgi:hypothetical protein